METLESSGNNPKSSSMMEKPDYYSEDVPAPEGESEVLESEPIAPKKQNSEVAKLVSGEAGEDSEKPPENADNNNELIENESWISDKSRSAFEHELVRKLDGVDFARNRGYEVSEVESGRAETIARIKSEILELELADERDGRNDVDGEEVKELKRRLKGLTIGESRLVTEWSQLVKTSNIKKDEEVQTKKEEGDDNGDGIMTRRNGHDLQQLAQLDSRISELEKTVGIANENAETGRNIQDEINDIYRRIKIVSGIKSGDKKLEKRLEELSNTLEEYLRRSRRIGSEKRREVVPLTDQQVSRVYDQLSQMPRLETVVPLMVKRLQSVNDVVTEAANVSSFVRNLQGEMDRMELELANWNGKLDKMEEKRKRDGATWEKNKQELEAAIEKLEKK